MYKALVVPFAFGGAMKRLWGWFIGVAGWLGGAAAEAQAAPSRTSGLDSARMKAGLVNGMRLLAPAQFVLDHRVELGLTPEQVPVLESLVRAQADSMRARVQRRVGTAQPKRTAGSTISWTGPIDEQAIRETARLSSEGAALNQIDLARDRHAVGAVLTPDQIAMLPGLEAADMMKSVREPRVIGGLPGKGGVYFEFQVEKAVRQVPGTGGLKYPDMLRAAQVEGQVLVQFVVDTAGVYEDGTFKVLKSSHELFTQAVRETLPLMRFTPAEVGGAKVRQLVQQPFTFSLPRDR